MKKIILGWAFAIGLAASASGQTSSPTDTGAVSPPAQAVPADTQTIITPPEQSAPADTGTTPSSQPASPADTGGAPPAPAVPADTGSAAPPPPAPPADTGAVSAPPVERAPADTGAVVPAPVDTAAPAVPPKEAPADTGTVVTPPAETQAPAPAPQEVFEEAPKVKKENRLGIGITFNDEAPLSIRAWFNPKVGLDAGLGLKARRVDDTTTISDSTPVPTVRVTMLDLSFDLGIPIRVLRKEKVDFIVRPGFGFRSRPSFAADPHDPAVRSIETAVELEINGSVGFEYYPFEKVGFSLSAGLALITERTGGEISNTIVRLQSLPSKKGVNFTFRYYAF